MDIIDYKLNLFKQKLDVCQLPGSVQFESDIGVHTLNECRYLFRDGVDCVRKEMVESEEDAKYYLEYLNTWWKIISSGGETVNARS